jgi:hypothetical protein
MSIITNPRRDAHATFAGFVYQVNISILRWLNLLPDQYLELEAGEDIDLIQTGSGADEAEKQRLMEQLKHKKRAITLRSSDSLEAIANFCEHRSINPEANLRFRFLTIASITKERQPWHGSDAGIEVWERLRRKEIAEAERTSDLKLLREYLKGRRKPTDVSRATWASFRRVLFDSRIEAFGAIVDNFEWATGSGDHDDVELAVRKSLMDRAPEQSEPQARVTYHNLFCFVIKLLTRKGPKTLTSELLVEELAATTTTQDDHRAAAALRSWIDRVDATLENHETRIEILEQRASQERIPTFYVPAEDAGATGLLFDFNQKLRGRRRRLSELTAFLNDPEKRIAVLSGRGGVGKTKLLRDWSRDTGAWQRLWVNPHGTWSESTGGEVSDTDTFIIADDAHHYGYLEKLIGYVATTAATAKLKLIIATRPSGQGFVDEAIARVADESFISRFESLQEPGQTASLEIAKEVLGTAFEHLAEALARVSVDTPLVTVVGGRLIARGQILPELLANDQDFRKAVFAKFAEECEGDLPVGRISRMELLQLVAAVQPVFAQDESFSGRAAAFISMRPDQVWQGLDDLENRGILVGGQGGVRIVPDLFGDYLLESASVRNSGEATGFADAVFSAFEETHLGNLLKNFAELDWRITQANPESGLLDRIWDSIYIRFRLQNAAQRERFLRDAATIAAFQPERVQELARIAMDEPAESVREWSFSRKITQDDVLAEIPGLLGVTIFHESASLDAFNRLWILTKHDSSEVHDRARKTLKDAIGYRKYKNVLFNERILALVEERSLDLAAYEGDFTPLTLMDELLDREVDDTSMRGRAFSFTALPVNYPAIKGLRDRALSVIDRALHSESPRIALKAIDSLAHVLAEFHPKLRSNPTPEEHKWQDAERLVALDLLEIRIKNGNLPLQLLWRLSKLFRWVGRRDAQSIPVKQKAAALLQNLPSAELFDLFYVMCTSEYEDGIMEFNSVTVSPDRRAQEERAFADLGNRYSEVQGQIDSIDRLIQLALDAGVEPERLEIVLSRLCMDRAFLQGYSDYLVEHQDSLLASQANFALNAWRDLDPEKYLHYGTIFARSTNIRMACAAAMSVSTGPPLESPRSEDIALITILAQRPESYVLRYVLIGLRRLMRLSGFAEIGIELYAGIQVGNRFHLGKEYCETLGLFGILPGILNCRLVERILANLIEVDELDSDYFGSLMSRISGVAPLELVRFFESRIARRKSLDDSATDTDYKAIPSSISWSTLRTARENPDYNHAVSAFVHLAEKYPEFDHYLIPIFWHMADQDIPTLSALDGLLHKDGDAGPLLLNHFIREGPKGFALTQPMFTMHMLSTCAQRNRKLEQYARSALMGNALMGAGVRGFAGPTPPPPDQSHVSPAMVLSALWAPGSLAHIFYSDLAKAQQPTIPRPTFPGFSDAEDDELAIDDPESTEPETG